MQQQPYDLVTLTAQHAHYLRRQIGAPLEPIIAPTASKATMLSALEAAEIDLLQTITTIQPTLVTQQLVCGAWTLHELIGHLADWDRYFDNWLAELTGRPTVDLHWDDDGDAFNAWLNDQRRGEPWAQTWEVFRGNRQRLHGHLRIVTDEDFLWEQDRSPFPSIYHCAWSALEHYLDHATGLRRERQMPLAEDLLHFRGPYTD